MALAYLISCDIFEREVTQKYPNGQISYKGHMNKGQLVGEVEMFYSNAQPRSIEKRKHWDNGPYGKILEGKYFDTSGSLLSEINNGRGILTFMSSDNVLSYKTIYEQGMPVHNKSFFRNGFLSAETFYENGEYTKTLKYYKNGQVKQIRNRPHTSEKELVCFSEAGDTIDCYDLEFGRPVKGIRIGIMSYSEEYDIKSKMPIEIQCKSTRELSECYNVASIFENHRLMLANSTGNKVSPIPQGKVAFEKFGMKPKQKDCHQLDSELGYYRNVNRINLAELFNIQDTGTYTLDVEYYHRFQDENKATVIRSRPFSFLVYDEYKDAW